MIFAVIATLASGALLLGLYLAFGKWGVVGGIIVGGLLVLAIIEGDVMRMERDREDR